MAVVSWDRLPPPKPCVSPDGHEHLDAMNIGSLVPVLVVCPRCDQPWTVVVVDDDVAKEASGD